MSPTWRRNVVQGRRRGHTRRAAFHCLAPIAATACRMPGDLVGTPAGLELQVFAASSFASAFDAISRDFSAIEAGGGVTILPNYGASNSLRAQIEAGARADVYASADLVQMDLARTAGLIEGIAQVFARNRLVVIAPASNPSKVTGLADLARPGLRLVTTPPEVPLGGYTRAVLRKVGASGAYGDDFSSRVLTNVASEETNARQVVAKVQLAEADAGVCYATDVATVAASALVVVAIPDEFNVVSECAISVVAGSKAPRVARRYVDHVISPAGQAILSAAGFQTA